MIDKHILATSLLKTLLDTNLTTEQQQVITSFLKNNLIRDKLDPILDGITKEVNTNIRAMNSNMKVEKLVSYLDL